MAGGSIHLLSSDIGRLYMGVTSNLYLRVVQHKESGVGRLYCPGKTVPEHM